MAKPKSTVVLLMIMMVSSFQLQSTLANTKHIVGDALGWTIPPGGAATYATWASKNKFTVGDSLIFNFTTGFHNVAVVSQITANDPCTATNTLSVYPTSPVTIKLTRPGTHNYICTVIGHCQIGQKLTIHVSRARATSPQSTASSPSSSIANPPDTDASSPFPLPFNASPTLAAVVPVTFLAVALALFY